MRLGAARQKLLEFLESSSHYHAPQLLSKVQDSDLHRECALLYGRVSGRVLGVCGGGVGLIDAACFVFVYSYRFDL